MTHSFGRSAHWGGTHPPSLVMDHRPGAVQLCLLARFLCMLTKDPPFRIALPPVLVQQTHNSRPHFFVEALQIPKHCLLDIFFF